MQCALDLQRLDGLVLEDDRYDAGPHGAHLKLH